MIDFSREIVGVDDRRGTLGQCVFEIIAAWPQGQLDIGQVVAFGTFAKYAKLWEIQHVKRKGGM